MKGVKSVMGGKVLEKVGCKPQEAADTLKMFGM